MSFAEYVSFYGLNRSEGLVLRYFSDAYRALRAGVPAAARTEAVQDLTSWLGELVHQVDSSLLDEWARLTGPQPLTAQAQAAATRPVTANTRAFTVLVRNALFRRVELAAHRRYHELGAFDGADGWDAEAWQDALAGLLRGIPADRYRGDRPRAGVVRIDQSNQIAGWCARSSTIRPRTGTGPSRRGSTWRPATSAASRSSTSRRSGLPDRARTTAGDPVR